jgi:hypothetical protein
MQDLHARVRQQLPQEQQELPRRLHYNADQMNRTNITLMRAVYSSVYSNIELCLFDASALDPAVQQLMQLPEFMPVLAVTIARHALALDMQSSTSGVAAASSRSSSQEGRKHRAGGTSDSGQDRGAHHGQQHSAELSSPRLLPCQVQLFQLLGVDSRALLAGGAGTHCSYTVYSLGVLLKLYNAASAFLKRQALAPSATAVTVGQASGQVHAQAQQ